MFNTKKFLSDHRGNVPRETVNIAGEDVPCCGLTCLQLKQWNNYVSEKANADYTAAKLIQLGVRDASGEMLFKDSDLLLIIELPSLMTETLIRTILKLSGLTPDAEESILKNYLTHTADSSVDSAINTDVPKEN